MECPFCGAEVEDEDALQDHQAFQCSAIQPQKSQPQQEAAVRQARESPKGRFFSIDFLGYPYANTCSKSTIITPD